MTVKASRSIPCQLMNPWAGHEVRVVNTLTGAAVPHRMDRSNGECIVFEAEKGAAYSIDRA